MEIIMKSSLQHTIKKSIKLIGVGLHTGKEIELVIKPAPANSGIRFVRKDINPQVFIPARLEHIVDVHFATTIGVENIRVSTVEHLMSAFAGANIDNAIVELTGPEVPACDGSAYTFFTFLKKAGKLAQEKPRHYMKIIRPVSVSEGESFISIEPSDELAVTLEIDFKHPLIARQKFSGVINEQTFKKEIARARTFGFLKDVEMMQANGLALGGSLDNAVVLTESSIVNEEGLRFPDEFVKHKVLDLIGDLYLAGMPIIGHVKGFKSGHSLHAKLLKTIFKNSDSYKIIEKEKPSLKKAFWARFNKRASEAVAHF